MAPPSQKAGVRPIAFILQKQDGTSVNLPLVLRPEDLTRNEAALMTPTQTFAGAWIDDFGPGIASIQISGHTGWGQGQAPDGRAAFLSLHDTIWTQFHADRAKAVAAGKDPDATKLVFSDALDEIVCAVYPGAFTLRRSRSRPLLMMYQISMTVLSDTLAPALSDPLQLNVAGIPTGKLLAGIASLKTSIATITGEINHVSNLVTSVMANPLGAFMSLSASAMGSALGVVDPINGIVSASSQVLGVARSLAQTGRNVITAYNSVVNVSSTVSHQLSALAGAYENAFCVLSNALIPQRQYQDYSDLYGASGCSSTIGGSPPSPLAGLNPFDVLITPPTSGVGISQQAQSAITLINSLDPVSTPPAINTLAGALAQINSGVSLGGLL